MANHSNEKLEGVKGIIVNILPIVLIIAAIAVVVLFFLNFTFGFAPLLVVLLLLMGVVGLKVREYRMRDLRKAIVCSAVIVFTFGALCLFALNNYVNPSRAIITNNDHHALAVEGIHIRNTSGLKLAGGDENAFFDDERFSGSVILGASYEPDKRAENDTVSIIPFKKVGFSLPIYRRQRDTSYFLGIKTRLTRKVDTYFRDIEDNSEQVFSAGDKITLTQGRTTIQFQIIECKDSLASDYILVYNDGNTEKEIISPFHAYLRKSYPLAAMFQTVEVPGFDMEGITINRTIYYDTQVERIRKRYTKHGAKYRLSFNALADKSTRVNIGNNSFNPFTEGISNEFIADGKTVYAIGTAEEQVPQFRFYRERKGVSLRFRMPKYRYLSADYTREGKKQEEMSFMIASTILEPDGSVNQLIPENILLYDVFDHPDDIYQMHPAFLSFVSGATNDRLEFSLYSPDGSVDARGLVAGDVFPELRSRSESVSWILSADNFKDPSLVRPGEVSRPMSTRIMAIILILVTVFSVVMLFVRTGRKQDGTYVRAPRYTYVEPLAYMVLLAFLTIRLFLLWRISVFPPVMSTTVNEFNGIFRNPGNFMGFFTGGGALTWIIRLLIAFFLVIFCIKAFGLKEHSFYLEHLSKPLTYYSERRYQRFFIILLVISVGFFIPGALVIKLAHATNRIVCILVPLIAFFIIDFFSNRIFGEKYRKEYDSRVDLRYLWVLIVNSLAATIYCFVADGGFGIIFFIYSILNIIMRLIDAYLYKGESEDTTYISKWVYLLSVCAVGIIAGSKKMLLLLLNGPVFSIVLFLVLAVLFIVVLLTFNVIRISDRRVSFAPNAEKFLCIGMAIIVLISGLSVFAHKFFDGKHIEYRLRVHAEAPGVALGKMETATAERKFMEASINDWIMGEYELRGRMVNPIWGEKGHGYFRIQPQSKVGALWGAQTTDISLSRYVIAEHGGGIFGPAILLILALGLLLFLCVSFVSNRVWSKALITQIPLLFAVQALLVWMAVTQRFIFLGQDFPMISITSNLTSFVFIGFMMILVVAACTESALCYDNEAQGEEFENSEEIEVIRRTNFKFSYHVLVFSGVIFILLFGMGNQRRQQFYSVPKNDKQDKTAVKHYKKRDVTRYDVENSIEALKMCVGDVRKTEDSMTSFNGAFVEFQKHVMDSLSGKKNPIKNITTLAAYSTPYLCLNEFCKANNYIPDNPNNESPLNVYFTIAGKEYEKFCRMAFDRFLKKGAQKNDIDGLIFMVKKKSRKDGVLNVVYELKVRDDYYTRELPLAIRDSWKGNIVSTPVKLAAVDSIVTADVNGQFIIYSIPKELTGGKKDSRIIKSLSSNTVVVGKQKPKVLTKGVTCLLSEYDNVLVGGETIDLTSYGNVSYLAKNVMINGASTFIFPMQEKQFWMKPFSDAVKIDKASYDAKQEGANDDVYLTLSPVLTSSIYGVIEQKRPSLMTAVVVADGDGNIISLVDHKDPEHRLNPNDSRRIVKKENELRLEGDYYWGQEAENYFGNKAITNLRFGPGSSQKPLVWTAVTTEFNSDPKFWTQLKLAKINRALIDYADESKRYFSTHYIAGTLLSGGTKNSKGEYTYFKSQAKDEGDGADAVDLSFYIYKSSNYYNSVMSFIGSYSYDELKMGLSMNDSEVTLFKKIPESFINKDWVQNATEYKEAFPIMQLGNGKPFAFKEIPSVSVMNNVDNSVLVKGLRDNFSLLSQNKKANRLKIYNYETEKCQNRSDFAHPQVSYFYNFHRQSASAKERADNAIRYTALGAASVWQVSPLMMAQMYGNLISLNKNYKLSLQPSEKKVNKYELFDIDGVPEGYDNLGSYAKNRATFVDAMAKVFSIGTAGTVFKNISVLTKNTKESKLMAVSLDGEEKSLYMYGKTGTINGFDEDGHPLEDHMLAVVITDTDLKNVKEIEQYEKMKFYVIYIADFIKDKWQGSDAAIIDEVLKSAEFKTYMGIK